MRPETGAELHYFAYLAIIEKENKVFLLAVIQTGGETPGIIKANWSHLTEAKMLKNTCDIEGVHCSRHSVQVLAYLDCSVSFSPLLLATAFQGT